MTVEWKAGDLFQVKPGRFPGLHIFGRVTKVYSSGIEAVTMTFSANTNNLFSIKLDSAWEFAAVEKLEAVVVEVAA